MYFQIGSLRASSTWLLLLLPHLGVLPHIGQWHGGDLDGVAVDHLPQLVVWRKTGVEEGLELLSGVGWLGREG